MHTPYMTLAFHSCYLLLQSSELELCRPSTDLSQDTQRLGSSPAWMFIISSALTLPYLFLNESFQGVIASF